MNGLRWPAILGAGLVSGLAWTQTALAASRHPGNVSFLTGPQSGAPRDLALRYLRGHLQDYGLAESDLADFVVTRESTSPVTGITRIVLLQRHRGIEVWNGVISIAVARDGSIVSLANGFVSHLADEASGQVALSPSDAVARAAADLGLPAPDSLAVLRPAEGPDQETLLSRGGLSRQDIAARLVYEPSAGGARLAWNVVIDTVDSRHWWNVRVDAATGAVLAKNDWVANDAWGSHVERGASQEPASSYTPTNPVPDGSSYRVFEIPAESPNHVTPPSPADGRTTVAQPADATASDFGWHDTNGVAGPESTLTSGNNVDAYTDTDANNAPDPGSMPDGGAGLDFVSPLDLTLAPSAYRPASVTHLFYANNVIHDVSYLYGFTEAATNFQANNYGAGGLGNDSVQAESQDGSGTNGGNFATPPDGVRPRMQMFVWTLTTPARDGGLDNGVVWHEYGHGISRRLHPTVSCLSNAEQMGEGWSDWQAMIMTLRPGESGAVGRGIGTYILGQPTTGVGLRQARYSTDLAVNPFTYSNLPTLAIPHGVGFLWNTMLWEMLWALIDSHGGTIEPNLYDTSSTAGNVLAHKLVMAGMELDPCAPGFVDGRNAILQADQALTGGANQCAIWGAFAKRGLGFSASQGSSNSISDGTAAFDLPPTCASLCRAPNLAIPNADPGGVTDTLVVPAGADITDLNVSINATHTWVGDLAFTLTHTTTGTSVTVIDRPGVPATPFGCSGDDIAVTLDDEGGDGPVEAMCATASPALFGAPTPNNPLSAFDGQALAGTWTLRAVDIAGADVGTLDQWCLLPSTVPVELLTFTIE